MISASTWRENAKKLPYVHLVCFDIFLSIEILPPDLGTEWWKCVLVQQPDATAEEHAYSCVLREKSIGLPIRPVHRSDTATSVESFLKIEPKLDVSSGTASYVCKNEIDLCRMSRITIQIRDHLRLLSHFPEQLVFPNEAMGQPGGDACRCRDYNCRHGGHQAVIGSEPFEYRVHFLETCHNGALC